MKTVFLIYGISWTILLLVYVISLIQVHHGKSPISNNEWYYIVLLRLFAPLVVLVIPFILIGDHKKEKQNRKLKEEREKSEKTLETRRKVAIESYNTAKQLDNESLMMDCVSIAHKIKEYVNDKKYDKIFSLLDCISLPNGAKFGIAEANWDYPISKPFVSFISGEEDNDVFKYLIVKDTPMGAWQACLLYKLWHNLPLFDHSCYNHRTYINHSSEITDVHSIQKNDDDYIHHVLEKLEPIQTIISQNGNKYYIERHYWNDWEGLVRELVEVSFENNTVSIFDVESTVEVKHDCGIRF